MRAVLLALCVVALASPWVIYRRNHKKKLVCKEDASGNSTSMEETSAEESTPLTRRKRDIEVDPTHRRPIIYLGAIED
ncbi:unnamed protein product [Nippostrongylus brasiliensis]|uniref:Secreted protein n=1 Tax=Nippostrongylus brasiliensis TaxID=27835 RepID=A0A0N4Y299_NIPBR|nr:unnamed protein product [Nippostrongylus brasiliensis]